MVFLKKFIYRLTYQHDSLQKVANEQKLTIEKLSNNESWSKRKQKMGYIDETNE